MRRGLIACTIAAVITPCAVGASTADAPRAALNRFVCHTAPDAPSRWVSITAVMRPVTGTKRMALKFELERWAPGASSFTSVSGGDLGKWRYPTQPPTLGQRPGDVWELKKEVVDLLNGTYRFRVRFRWTGEGDQVLGLAVRLSPKCVEP